MKFLVVRFSSIGDIVLTTPVLRCLKAQHKQNEVHYLTKSSFKFILASNPNVDKIHSIENDVDEIIEVLKKEKFDAIIDLHHNLRTYKLKKKLNVKSYSFNKLNIEKWLMVYLKVNRLPQKHIVDRYFETVESFGVSNDLKGLDYFIPEADVVPPTELPHKFSFGYHALVIGGSYYTKKIPLKKLIEICEYSDKPLVLLGDKNDVEVSRALHKLFTEKTADLCGKINLNQSASLIQQAQKVITSDTGLMHIASAFQKPIISLWGNTIPEFGMSPYLPVEGSKIIENKNISCRPCSKLGFSKCPKGHFKCMNDLDVIPMIHNK